jgi:transcriptional regulator with PAS, ATPase and Fis domain
MLVGASPLMAELADFIRRAGPVNSTVLIEGESGTGKELVAQELHARSKRSIGPFIAVNCAAVPDTLLESEFFGYESGAFTGAVRARTGKFEQASGGTLFLDEIGEAGLSVQVKLLRALQERRIDRVGGTRPVPVDVRIIAATNCDLRALIRSGSFRPDLYYRLRVLTIKTPPLRQRRDDIPALARHFLSRYAKEAGRTVRDITPQAEALLMKYDWPGNVRQLQNVMERAVVLGSSEVVRPDDLPEELHSGVSAIPESEPRTYYRVLRDTKRSLFETALSRAAGDYKEAAVLLGLHPKCMHRFLKQLELTHLLK